MSALLPPSTNPHYTGAAAAAWFLTIYGAVGMVAGMIHSFAPDGGAGSIAGIDLSQNGARTIALFAWAGATQLVHAFTNLIIGLRYRTLVPLMLAINLAERFLLAWSAWVVHAPVSGHHPPGHYGTLIMIPVVSLFLWLALRPRAAGTQGDPLSA